MYFSESSHVAYQIKADDAGSNIVANILPTDTPLTQGVGSLHTSTTPGVGSKGHFLFFLKVVMLLIKVKWKKCRPTCKVTLRIYTQS